ncbi:hypothetical protein GCM10029978_099890 [Actinoallomurus acanthiterrae]
MIAVRSRASAQGVIAATGTLVLVAVSVAFAVSGARDVTAVGGMVALAVGVAGIALFGGGLVVAAGRAVSGRPVLEVDEAGVRLPAAWPWSRSRDRRLPWPEVAAVVVWSREIPRGRQRVVEHVAFLPTEERAEGSSPPPSAELLAMGLDDVPGVATLHWSVEVSPGWDTDLATVLTEIHRRGVPTADVRSR